jgi:uncharacterized protein (TIGR03083 family)
VLNADTARARLLGRAGGSHAMAAWASDQPWSRRAAWRVSRAGGSWDRVEADLRASADPDPDLAALGRAGVGNWLATEASRTWALLHGPQRVRLHRLISGADLTERHRRLIGFHTGIGDDSGPPAGSLTATDPGGTMNDTSTTDIWPSTHAERAALAADLADLTDEQWATPSLCAGLSVREVLAHLTSAATLGRLRWTWSVLRCRFDFGKHVADRLAEELGATPAETLARFERIVTSRTSTFGPKAAWLGEVVVHAEDIRRPLGIHHDYPVDVVTRVAEFYVGADFTVPSKSLTSGLRLVATDGPFAAGDGPLVRGTTLALTMAMAGRGAYCEDLTGAGVATLRTRARDAGST